MILALLAALVALVVFLAALGKWMRTKERAFLWTLSISGILFLVILACGMASLS